MASKEKKEFEDTPQGWADKWSTEFAAAKPMMTKFHKQGDKVYKIFLADVGLRDDRVTDEKLNLFYANIVTVQSIMFGNLPKAEVDRTFADANDDIARVAAEMLQRMLNQDIQDPGNDLRCILEQALSDRLIPGMGNGRVKYDFVSEMQQVPGTGTPDTFDPMTGATIKGIPLQQEEKITEEWVDIIYTHWKDFMWSPARTHAELRWKAFRSYMDKDELEKRFGAPAAPEGTEDEPAEDAEGASPGLDISKIPMTSKGPFGKDDRNADMKQIKPQAEVWEIYNKENRKVYWFVENFDQILDSKDDPLELEQFWPDAPPMIANATTSKYVPKSDYAMAQDLYSSVDILEQRISRLTEACKLVGCYDKKNDDVKRIFQEGVENQLIPVDNWAMFAEQGGLEGAIDWLPLEAVTTVIEKLTELQQTKIQQLYELTGMADVLRGASQQQYTSAEETKTKTLYGSVRLQRLQNEFAYWVAALQNLKAEIICKHFQPDSIIKQSNIMMTVDGPLAQKSVAFMKRDDSIQFRIRVQPESMAMADYAQMKADRSDFLMSISQYMQSMAPLIEQNPQSTPLLMQLLQWGLAGFKGSQEIEGVLDQAVKEANDAAKKAAANPKPTEADAKSKAIQEESQAKIAVIQAQAASDAETQKIKQAMELERAQADHQASLALIEQNKALETLKFENAMELAKAQLVVNLAKIGAQKQADLATQAVDLIGHVEKAHVDAAADTHAATLGAAQEEHSAEVQKGLTDHQAKSQKEVTTHAAKVQVQSNDKGNGGDK